MESLVFSRDNILKSVGAKLNKLFGIKVYINPNPQVDVNTPCFFVQYLPNSSDHLKPEVIKDYFIYNLDIDITYLQDVNDVDSYTKANGILDVLDTEFVEIELINEDGVIVGSLDVHRPRSNWAMRDFHYQFNIVFRVKKIDNTVKPYRKLKTLKIGIQEKNNNQGGNKPIWITKKPKVK